MSKVNLGIMWFNGLMALFNACFYIFLTHWWISAVAAGFAAGTVAAYAITVRRFDY